MEADFSGGHLSSDGGCLLLGETDRLSGLCAKLAGCLTDLRNPRLVEHSLPVMLGQLPGTERNFAKLRYQTLKTWCRWRRDVQDGRGLV